MDELRLIRKKIKKQLDKKRYEHTLGVMYTAASMAMRYSCDIEKAMLAGLLHDCAKCFSEEEQVKMCDKYQLLLSDIEYDNPALVHPKLGVYLARTLYQIEDIEVLNAILNHTTGCPDMTLLDKIIYISDFIEPSRNQIPNLKKIRELAFVNIDQALVAVLKSSLVFLEENHQKIDSMTIDTYNYYKNIVNNKQQDN